MTIVVDASMVAVWLLPDERSEATDAILRALGSSAAAAPSILHHEVRNILVLSERRKRISAAKVSELLARFAGIAIDHHGAGNDREIVRLARAHRLTAYDAAYLALALSTDAPLATLDRACGVAILGPLAP